MKPALHQYEDKLLEFAYGELPAHEAAAVEAHLPGCTRCSAALANIQAVRKTMGQLPPATAPDAGLESLLAYADQAARRASAGAPQRSGLRRWLLPLSAVFATLTFGVITWQQREQTDLSPRAAMVEAKQAERAERDLAPKAPPAALAPAPLDREEPQPAAAAKDEKVALNQDFLNAMPDREAPALSKDLRRSKVADKRAEAQRAPSEAAPGAAQGYEQLAGLTVGAPTPSPKSSAQRRAGTSAADDGWGASGGKSANAPVREPEAPRVQAQAVKEQPSKADGALGQKKAPDEEVAAYAPPPPAVQAAAPAPVAVASSSGPASSKGSLKLGLNSGPLGGSGRSTLNTSAAEDEAAQGAERSIDALRADRDAASNQRQRALSVDETLRQSRAAEGGGDRQGAVRLALAAINQGAVGAQLLQALQQACDGYEALGEEDRAAPYCRRLVSEFPSSAAARSYASRAVRSPKRAAESKSAAPAETEKATAKPVDPKATTY